MAKTTKIEVRHTYSDANGAACWRVCELADGRFILSVVAERGDYILAAALGTVQDERKGCYRAYDDYASARVALLEADAEERRADHGIGATIEYPDYGLEDANT